MCMQNSEIDNAAQKLIIPPKGLYAAVLNELTYVGMISEHSRMHSLRSLGVLLLAKHILGGFRLLKLS